MIKKSTKYSILPKNRKSLHKQLKEDCYYTTILIRADDKGLYLSNKISDYQEGSYTWGACIKIHNGKVYASGNIEYTYLHRYEHTKVDYYCHNDKIVKDIKYDSDKKLYILDGSILKKSTYISYDHRNNLDKSIESNQ